jgi:putative SOS response-associated peptidase YedK
MLKEADWPLWLGEKTTGSEAGPASLIHPSAAGFRTWRVATTVNNVRHDAASLLDPV